MSVTNTQAWECIRLGRWYLHHSHNFAFSKHSMDYEQKIMLAVKYRHLGMMWREEVKRFDCVLFGEKQNSKTDANLIYFFLGSWVKQHFFERMPKPLSCPYLWMPPEPIPPSEQSDKPGGCGKIEGRNVCGKTKVGCSREIYLCGSCVNLLVANLVKRMDRS